MLVSKQNLSEVIANLTNVPYLGLDTETYGLGWRDRMFSLIIGDTKTQYYFNFLDAPDHLGGTAPPEFCLDYEDTIQSLEGVLYQDTLWFMHNAKYDLRRLSIEGVDPLRMLAIHDTEVTERILRNDRLTYSLGAVAKEYGFEKDATVDEYITKYKLYDMVEIPGKKTRVKDMHFDLVPFPIMSSYGCTDVKITYSIGMEQRNALGL